MSPSNQPPQKRQNYPGRERLRVAVSATVAGALLAFAGLATASDYEREARFADLRMAWAITPMKA